MAIGPDMFFEQYKNLSIKELKKKLKGCNSLLYRVYLWVSRVEERIRKIDDNCCVDNDSTEKEVLRILIEFKTKYPHCDLSNSTFFEAERMLGK